MFRLQTDRDRDRGQREFYLCLGYRQTETEDRDRQRELCVRQTETERTDCRGGGLTPLSQTCQGKWLRLSPGEAIAIGASHSAWEDDA